MEKKTKKAKTITVKANKKGRHIQPFMNFLRVLVVPVYYLLKPFRFYGERKVGNGAYIFVCNHYTMFDMVYPATTTWESIHILAKSEVKKQPVIGWLAKAIKVIFANRDGNDARTLLDCIKCLKNGEKLLVFPEGTRNKTQEEMLEFKHGASVMAIKTKTPIIPIVIYEKPRLFKKAHILIDKPIELTEYYDRKLTPEEYAEADEKIRKRMLEMKAEHRAYLESKKKK
ncbi:MAG: 1-acyl-sn-glycerol-3-phosphate acyltransferase [Clostridia bacterium]|nr:1-acyl-sn-glycerol-3-phosphate acyltransferase [Clostridia bacterium]